MDERALAPEQGTWPERTAAIVGLALIVVIVVGAVLRLRQYSANTSLWIDEIALAKAILAPDLRNILWTK